MYRFSFRGILMSKQSNVIRSRDNHTLLSNNVIAKLAENTFIMVFFELQIIGNFDLIIFISLYTTNITAKPVSRFPIIKLASKNIHVSLSFMTILRIKATIKYTHIIAYITNVYFLALVFSENTVLYDLAFRKQLIHLITYAIDASK